MAIETSENEQGGTTYTLRRGDRIDDLPPEIAALATEEDRLVFRNPVNHLARIAAHCRSEPLRMFLERLIEGGFCTLDVHHAVVQQQPRVEISDVYFNYWVDGPDRLVSLQFHQADDLDWIHPALMPVFDRVRYIDPVVWGCAGGQLGYDPTVHGLLANEGWIADRDQIEASRIRTLYRACTGDSIGCRDDGTAVLCDHGRLEPLGPIDDFFRLYFDLLVIEGDEYFDLMDAEKFVARLKQR